MQPTTLACIRRCRRFSAPSASVLRRTKMNSFSRGRCDCLDAHIRGMLVKYIKENVRTLCKKQVSISACLWPIHCVDTREGSL